MYQSKIRDRKKRGNAKTNELAEPSEEHGESFGLVNAMLGNGRLHALTADGKLMIGRIAGSMRKYSKKVIINRGDLILLSHRDYEPSKVDVIGKYTNDQMSHFLRKGFLPEKIAYAITHADVNNCGKINDGEDFVLFANDDEKAESEGEHEDEDDKEYGGVEEDDEEDDEEEEIDIDAI